jgi:DNA-binding CsgD family transcriptional regulator
MVAKSDILARDFQSVLHEIDESPDVQSAVETLQERYDLGHVTYHLAQADFGDLQFDSPFVRTTYPALWVRQYLVKDYIKVDPIIKEGLQRDLPFDWSEVTIGPEAIDMMKDFQAHGLGMQGLSIPLKDKSGRRALLSFNGRGDERDWNSHVVRFRREWIELANALHRKAIVELYGDTDPAPVLSPRELETLVWTARGKDYKEIAKIVDVSEHTIRTYMRSTRFKLNCSNLTQSVAKAIKLRLINP